MNLCLAVLVTKKLVNIVQLPIAYEIEKLNLIFRSTREAGEKIPRPLAFLLMSLDLVECASRASARNKKPPAMRVGDKNYIKKASFALRCRCSSQSQ